MKKRITLIILFLIPVLIYLFLQLFGKNQYNELARYHTEGIPLALNCDSKQGAAHYLPSSFGSFELRDHVSIVVPLKTKESNTKDAFNQLLRVKEAFKTKTNLNIIGVCEVASKSNYMDYPLDLVTLEKNEFEDFMACSLIQKDTLRITLVDEKGLIRGYYPFTDRKEIDRLLLETNVLFYGNQN